MIQVKHRSFTRIVLQTVQYNIQQSMKENHCAINNKWCIHHTKAGISKDIKQWDCRNGFRYTFFLGEERNTVELVPLLGVHLFSCVVHCPRNKFQRNVLFFFPTGTELLRRKKSCQFFFCRGFINLALTGRPKDQCLYT